MGDPTAINIHFAYNEFSYTKSDIVNKKTDRQIVAQTYFTQHGSLFVYSALSAKYVDNNENHKRAST